MKSRSNILVITVLFSRINKTLNLINSLEVLNKRDLKLDHLMINNNSNEKIPNKINNYCHKFINLDSNLGFGGACNLGINYAIKYNYDYVWFLNNDILFSQELYDELLLNIYKYNAITTPMTYINGTFETNGSGYINFFTGRGYKNKFNKKFNYFNFACTIMETKVLKKIGSFDSKNFFLYWEDADLGFRFLKNKYSVYFTNISAVHDDYAKTINIELYSKFNTSACNFFKKNTPLKLGIIPAFIGTFLRSLKRLVKFEFSYFNESWIGFIKVFITKN